MKRVGIVGARTNTNRRKIKEFVFKLKQQFEDKVEVVSGGQKLGADGFAKKFALEFDMKYVEFPPRHYTYNQHCILDESHYGKRYFPKNFFDRNKQTAHSAERSYFKTNNATIISNGFDISEKGNKIVFFGKASIILK